MNNAIFATIFVAMIMATGLTAAYVFVPSPAVLYEPVEGESLTQQGTVHSTLSRGR